uniref:Stealth protein CR2 conserved region 2 domain-containing protein n=1 Tax=Arcella intermedia TaxID=1963864 RepID=A0A6B2L9C0_9EUKA
MARGELRKGMNKAVDYFQFVLRSVDEKVRFYRFLVLVIPDGVLIPQYLNVSSPKLKIVKHSDFIPLQYLPTFNPEMVKVYLHKIPGLSNDFIFLNENTFFLSDVELSLFRKLDTGSYIVRTIENAFFPKSGFIKDASRSHTYATYPSPIPSHLKFDTLSPVLLNRPFLTRLLENEYPLLVQNISTHKFLLPDQISMLEFYLIHLVQAHPPPSQPKDSKDSKLNLVFEDSLLKVLEDIEKNSNQIDNWRSKNKILNIPDILLLNLHQQAEIGSLLYTLYPNLSRLEVDVEDYSRIGLFVAVMFWFGGITICYTFTRMMGGHIKEDAFGGKREL